MKAGIFVTMAGRKAAGPETYEVSLVRALAEAGSTHEFTVFCLSEEARQSFGVAANNVHFQVLRGTRWLSVPVGLPLRLRTTECEMLHATLISPPFVPRPLIFTVHDLTMLRNPEFYDPFIRFRLEHSIRPAIKGARMLICISDFVRRELQECFSIPDDRIAVVHHGVDPAYKVSEKSKELINRHLGIDRPYLLFVGQMKLRKNMCRILEAFALVREAGLDLALVLAGRRGRTSEGMDEVIARHRLRAHVVEPGHVPNDLLPHLYSGAEAFVFPSLNEGFGLPVLEAMACGTPVVTSNSSALPEVAGEAAFLVDPTSTEAIAEGIRKVLTDSSLRANLVVKGLKRSAQFNWPSVARQTLKVYEQALA